MPFTIKSRKAVETPLESEYKKQLAWHTRDNDPSVPKPPPKQLRSFALVEDTVTISTDLPESTPGESKAVPQKLLADDSIHDTKSSEPVTPAERNELGIFSIRV